MTHTEMVIAYCGHEVSATVSAHGEIMHVPSSCDACDQIAEEEGQCWADEREGNGYPFGTIGAMTR